MQTDLQPLTRPQKRHKKYGLPLLLTLLLLAVTGVVQAASNSISVPDESGGGEYTSLVLDSSGNPVVSYFDGSDLKLLYCNDPNCSGGDESIASPDTDGEVGLHTSLVLDSSGNPVVSYFDYSNETLKLMHCNDPNCTGGDESITFPDPAGYGGFQTSLVLASSGNPVVSYFDGSDLKLLHCNDPDCSGGDEFITSPDTGGDVGRSSSLVLDSSGNPIVSYYDASNGDLKLLHCNDPNCTGGDESITAPDTDGNVGSSTSLVLDSSSNPIVGYYDQSNRNLKLLHCNDPNCTGGDESITSPDTDGNVGWDNSLVLDSSGNPVVSYYDVDYGNLKLLHCGSPTCIEDTMPPTANPTLDPAPNAAGWHNSEVTITWNWSDESGGSGIDSDNCTSSTTVTSEGSSTVTAVCADLEGNSAESTPITINLDETAPVVSLTGVADGDTYILGSVPSAGCATSDALSGVAVAASLTLSGGNPDGSGSITATCDGALDNADNSGAVSVSYTVLTPQEAIGELQDDIQTLVDDGVLNNGQANGLTQPLDNAIRSLNRGKTAAACSQIGDFIAGVEAMTPDPLDAATAAELIADAAAIQEAIGCQ